MTHCERILELLADGEPHSYLEGYRLGVMLHSRVSDLRKRGHVIECWRDGEDYLYQLGPSSAGTGAAVSSPVDEEETLRAVGHVPNPCPPPLVEPVQLRLVEAA